MESLCLCCGCCTKPKERRILANSNVGGGVPEVGSHIIHCSILPYNTAVLHDLATEEASVT